jgi:hypothetical protein
MREQDPGEEVFLLLHRSIRNSETGAEELNQLNFASMIA